jgi:hypothetical protein
MDPKHNFATYALFWRKGGAMKHLKFYPVCFLIALLLSIPARAAENPKPFGFEPGKTPYAAAIDLLRERDWKYREYEKSQFKEIGPQDHAMGKPSFLMAEPVKEIDGIKRFILFFNDDDVLDALMVVVEPNLFESIVDELDHRYQLVEKHLEGRSFTSDYPRVLWEQGGLYIELQRLTPHHVRLMYVQRLLYENYKDFLYKTYEPFRRKLIKKAWMDDL